MRRRWFVVFQNEISGKARKRDDASIVPYKSFATFTADGKVSPRRGEGTPPYKLFIRWQRMINCSVGNGLDRSKTLRSNAIINLDSNVANMALASLEGSSGESR